jgi:hypothetical protein
MTSKKGIKKEKYLREKIPKRIKHEQQRKGSFS